MQEDKPASTEPKPRTLAQKHLDRFFDEFEIYRRTGKTAHQQHLEKVQKFGENYGVEARIGDEK